MVLVHRWKHFRLYWDWESIKITHDCCSNARSGCVQRGQPTPTQRTPTVTCEAKKFSDFHEDKIFFRYEPVLYDYIWHRAHGRNMIWTNIFDVCSPSIPSHLLLWHQNWTRSYFGLWNTILYCQVPFLKWKKFFGPENNQSTEVDRFLSIVLWTTWISCCCSAFHLAF